ncbi:MAG: hypothetical protein ACUZ77_01795 [Candidatus Brocadiales bacterium]
MLTHIITPAAKECGYETIRADKISEPGMITSQVIQHLVDDPLVIADLTGRNPNVFYELAVRHAVKKPCIQVIQMGEPIPFDVAQSRAIQVDHQDLDSAARCREELVKQIHSVEKDPTDVDTPISVAIDLQSLRQSENPLEKSSAEIISMLQDLRSAVGELNNMLTTGRQEGTHPLDLSELAMLVTQMKNVLDLDNDEEPSRERFDEVQHLLRRMERMLSLKPGLSDLSTKKLLEYIT